MITRQNTSKYNKYLQSPWQPDRTQVSIIHTDNLHNNPTEHNVSIIYTDNHHDNPREHKYNTENYSDNPAEHK